MLRKRRDVPKRGPKRNCSWSPKGREYGYLQRYVRAVLAHDYVQISMCLTKDRHASERDAYLAMQRRETDTGKLLRSYHCPYCGGYHLTSQPEREEYLLWAA